MTWCKKLLLHLPILLLLTAIVGLFFLPFFQNPSLLLDRNTDIQEFLGVYGFFQQYIKQGFIPLWQNRILSGSPFLGDPQNPLVYPFNYVLLFVSTQQFFLISFFVHAVIAALGTYWLARICGISRIGAVASGISYAFAPFIVAHMGAGHSNMLVAFAWVPVFFAAFVSLHSKRGWKHALIAGIAAAYIFVSYITIFLYVAIASIFLVVFFHQYFFRKHVLIPMMVSGVVFLLIAAPQLMAAISYFPLTTRDLITISDVGPQIVSIRRFIHAIINPYTYGLIHLGGDSTFAFGITIMILAGYGFLRSHKKIQIGVVLVAMVAVFLTLNTKMPLYSQLVLLFPQLLLFRIASRVWFVLVLIAALLAGRGIAKLRYTDVRILMVVCIVIELLLFQQQYFRIHENQRLINPVMTDIIKTYTHDPGFYRLYCPTACIPDVYQYGKGLAHGYNPVMMDRYFHVAQKAGGYGFGQYAPSLPPYQTYVDQPQPDSIVMGMVGVRFVVSPYQLTDPGFVLIEQKDTYFVYQNTNEKPRAYMRTDTGEEVSVSLTRDLPGLITVSTNGIAGELIINEIYTPSWQARSGNTKLSVVPYEDAVLHISVPAGVTEVVVQFHPPFAYLLLVVSWGGLLIAVGLLALRYFVI